jgi:hypothetical protein
MCKEVLQLHQMSAGAAQLHPKYVSIGFLRAQVARGEHLGTCMYIWFGGGPEALLLFIMYSKNGSISHTQLTMAVS